MNRRHFIRLSAGLIAGTWIPSWLSSSFAIADHCSMTWQSIPLTTRRMCELGISGGDGFQYVHALAYSTSDPQIVYLSVDQSGVWRSEDGGRSWHPKFKGFFAYGARSIAVDPFNSQVVLAAGFLGFNRKGASKYPNRHQGVYLTLDGGESWRMVWKTDFFKQISKGELFLFEPLRGKIQSQNRCLQVWCASASEGLLESKDGGETWRTTSCRDIEIHDLTSARDGQGTILLASTKGLFSYRSGILQKIGQGLADFPRSIATSKAAPHKVYAAVGLYGVEVSNDYGKTFKKNKRFILPPADITDIAVSPVDAGKIYIRANLSSKPPYTSNDGGKSWRAPEGIDPEKLLGKPGFYFSSPFAPHPTDPQTCLHVTNGRARIIRTDNGGKSWHFSGTGFTGARMADILFLSSGHMIFCLTDHGLFETKDNGRTFTELKIKRIHGAKSASAGSVSGKNIVVGLGPWGKKGLAVSHNGGIDFKSISHLKDRFYFVVFHPSIPGLVYAGPYLSKDYGRNWQRLSETVLAMSPDGSLLYALKAKNKRNSTILVSRDLGANFIPEIELDIPINVIKQIVVTPAQTLLLATTKGVYRIEKQQVELRDHNHGLEKDAFGTMYTQCVNYDPNNPDRVFAGRRALGYGNGNGVFMSLDNGRFWQEANFNLSPGVTVFAIKINPFDSSVYIGTSFGTFRMKQISTEEVKV